MSEEESRPPLGAFLQVVELEAELSQQHDDDATADAVWEPPVLTLIDPNEWFVLIRRTRCGSRAAGRMSS